MKSMEMKPDMLTLPPASGIEYISSWGSHKDLWHKITMTYLIRWDLLCEPFKLNGSWVAAMRRPVKMDDPADKIRLCVWSCKSCLKYLEIPQKLARMLRAGEIAYVCGPEGHRIEMERWRR